MFSFGYRFSSQFPLVLEVKSDLFSGYDMSPFIRRYAKYLGEKSTAYRGTAMDFCKVKRGSVSNISREQTGDEKCYSGKTEEP